MRLEQLRGRPRRRFVRTTQADPAAAPAPNHLQQRFVASTANRVWVSDITALATTEGFLYLAVILDLWSRRIVGWAVRPTLDAELACAAWHLAAGRRQPPPGLIHHSDRGAQYTSRQYQTLLRASGAICSMSRKGYCWDNAPAESFFRSLKVELEPAEWSTRRAAAQAVATYIDGFYNPVRLHSAIGYRSPMNFEARMVAA